VGLVVEVDTLEEFNAGGRRGSHGEVKEQGHDAYNSQYEKKGG